MSAYSCCFKLPGLSSGIVPLATSQISFIALLFNDSKNDSPRETGRIVTAGALRLKHRLAALGLLRRIDAAIGGPGRGLRHHGDDAMVAGNRRNQ